MEKWLTKQPFEWPLIRIKYSNKFTIQVKYKKLHFKYPMQIYT